jgi:hypothetical protein
MHMQNDCAKHLMIRWQADCTWLTCTLLRTQQVVLMANGHVAVWGNSGNDYNEDSLPPKISEAQGRIVAVSARGYHTCALLDDNTARCWGRDADGESSGIDGQRGVKAVAAGIFHTVALFTNSSVGCWGRNCALPSASKLHSSFKAVAAGYDYSAALTQDGLPAHLDAGYITFNGHTYTWPEPPSSFPNGARLTAISGGANYTAGVHEEVDMNLVMTGALLCMSLPIAATLVTHHID